MQKQKGDVAQLLQSIDRMESELQRLRQEVLDLIKRQRRPAREAKSGSLYGVLPPASTPLEEFRQVRRSGTPRALKR